MAKNEEISRRSVTYHILNFRYDKARTLIYYGLMKVLNLNISDQAGFSLVELAMVLVVVGLLIGGIFRRARC